MGRRRGSKGSGGGTNRPTFRDYLAMGVAQAARAAWEKAYLAGQIRHAARRAGGHRRGARLAAEVKARAIRRVLELAPQQVVVLAALPVVHPALEPRQEVRLLVRSLPDEPVEDRAVPVDPLERDRHVGEIERAEHDPLPLQARVLEDRRLAHSESLRSISTSPTANRSEPPAGFRPACSRRPRR